MHQVRFYVAPVHFVSFHLSSVETGERLARSSVSCLAGGRGGSFEVSKVAVLDQRLRALAWRCQTLPSWVHLTSSAMRDMMWLRVIKDQDSCPGCTTFLSCCPFATRPRLLAGAACLYWCVMPASCSWKAATTPAAATATPEEKEGEEGKPCNDQRQRSERHLTHPPKRATFRPDDPLEQRHQTIHWEQKQARQALLPPHHQHHHHHHHHHQEGTERVG